MKQCEEPQIYPWISNDPDDRGLGVGRQVEDYRRLAGERERGWVVAEFRWAAGSPSMVRVMLLFQVKRPRPPRLQTQPG